LGVLRYLADMEHRRRRRGRTYAAPLDRLTSPLVRVDGELVAASWDDALDRVATGFARIRDEHGPEGFGMFSCSKATNEMNYAAQKFIRTAMGSNNIDSCNRT
jgi:predicted molibdopterin-dependent oxidoreductase YjgC